MANADRHPQRRTLRARALAAGAALALVAPLAACGSDDEGGVPVLNLYQFPVENMQGVVDRCNQEAAGKYRIAYQVLPRTADDQRVQMVRRLAAEDDSMDILGMDVTWTQEFASADWIREFTGQDKADVENGTLEGPLASAEYEGKLYAAPNNTNVQLLWYRKDLVPTPPKTWDEMIQMSQQLKAQGQPYQVLTMGAQYEGLVVLFNSLVASAGGHVVDDSGKTAVMDAGTVKALEVMKNFATAGVTSPSFPNAIEDDVRLAFQGGGGAFQLNWPYVWASMQKDAPDLAKNVAWARYPGIDASTPSVTTIGGSNMAVSAYSRHPQQAFEAIRCLRGPESQKFLALNAGQAPSIEAVYADPEMTEAYPMKEVLLEELKTSAPRPRTPAYQNLSTVVAAELSPPSSIQPAQTAETLKTSIQQAIDSKGVLP
ncbi:ABC transporter substrate-binding protein [Paractinoplanes rishiriensis]|uniref:Sugar ABC transporter substrate-binding protein n=1 Tax=Paractinoplanes rishiriensis TaxID=1050105 RepID=A0A919K6D5_9ACTN|nr:ABC transporter substrate-binding protein [Actinoplanes rishiriensis]GIE99745.1 sugar ABC transporter substrate-binding protein [Actinoplanes rishiriensis]